MVAFVDGTAASGAYITAIAADHIVARETSLVGSIGVLCQLEATVPLRAMELRWSPGFRATIADHLGVDDTDLLAEATAELALRHAPPRVVIPRPRTRRRQTAAA